MDAQGSEGIFGGQDGRERVVHAEIPQFHLAVAAARDELSQTAALHVDIGDPLFVLTPDLDHGCGRLQSLIEDTNGAVTKSSNKDVASYLV